MNLSKMFLNTLRLENNKLTFFPQNFLIKTGIGGRASLSAAANFLFSFLQRRKEVRESRVNDEPTRETPFMDRGGKGGREEGMLKGRRLPPPPAACRLPPPPPPPAACRLPPGFWVLSFSHVAIPLSALLGRGRKDSTLPKLDLDPTFLTQ